MVKQMIYVLVLVTLVNQIAKVYSQYPVAVKIDPKKRKSIGDMSDKELEAHRNADYDPWWLKGHPDRELLIKNFKAWNACTYSRRPKSECEELFEILVAPAQLITTEVQYYRQLINDTVNEYIGCLESEKSEEECSQKKLDKERMINELKEELFPWPEIYEICITAQSKSFCEYYMKYLHLPENRVMTADGLKQLMQVIVCLESLEPEDSGDKCLKDFKVPVIENMKDKVQIITHKKHENEL